METELPTLPSGEVTLYHLTGERDFPEGLMSPRTIGLPKFRETPILSAIILTDDLAASLRRTLASHHTYQGEPMRCFIPRHGLRFVGRTSVDALICLECHLAYFWFEDTLSIYPLSPTAVDILSTHFRSAEPAAKGLSPPQILHEASFEHPSGCAAPALSTNDEQAAGADPAVHIFCDPSLPSRFHAYPR